MCQSRALLEQTADAWEVQAQAPGMLGAGFLVQAILSGGKIIYSAQALQGLVPGGGNYLCAR